MKKIVYYIAVAFLAINFSSCSDFLDLPSKSKTDSESVFSSIDKAEMAVLACYTGVWMQDAWYKAVWNFTPFRIRVPENIVVQNTSLYAHLAVMFNRLNVIQE